MQAKAYLQEIRKLDRKIQNKQMEVESLRELLLSITAHTKEINVQSSGPGDKVGDNVAKIIDLQDEINADIDKYVDRKLEAIRKINELGNDDYAGILIRRYVKYEDWNTIAEALGYTRQGIAKKHGLALLEFEKVYT